GLRFCLFPVERGLGAESATGDSGVDADGTGRVEGEVQRAADKDTCGQQGAKHERQGEAV
ncbi:MAG TPA: hypothetical protein PL016_07220, partial [Kiritimatiellia bacterium]|nr:hypothetical protein [Kiritimatiellia bacterium]